MLTLPLQKRSNLAAKFLRPHSTSWMLDAWQLCRIPLALFSAPGRRTRVPESESLKFTERCAGPISALPMQNAPLISIPSYSDWKSTPTRKTLPAIFTLRVEKTSSVAFRPPHIDSLEGHHTG